MQFLMSRYGGQAVIIGKGKASNENLPEDQSIDYLLDHYAKEIIPNHFYISSYDAMPEWMGYYDKLPLPKTVKLGTLEHNFHEVLSQYDITATTDIYISYHQWINVFAVFIKTHKDDVKWVVNDYKDGYDYVLTLFIRNKIEGVDQRLKNNPNYIVKILLLLFYKMNLTYKGDILSFSPSKTYLGKRIPKEFIENITEILVDIQSDEELSKILMRYLP